MLQHYSDTVRAWEQGKRQPDCMGLMLLRDRVAPPQGVDGGVPPSPTKLPLEKADGRGVLGSCGHSCPQLPSTVGYPFGTTALSRRTTSLAPRRYTVRHTSSPAGSRTALDREQTRVESLTRIGVTQLANTTGAAWAREGTWNHARKPAWRRFPTVPLADRHSAGEIQLRNSYRRRLP